MSRKNAAPANIWEVLRRLLDCNKQQLAAHLGVSVATLRRWEKVYAEEGTAGKAAAEKCSLLLETTLRQANAEVYSLPINYGMIRTIGGRR